MKRESIFKLQAKEVQGIYAFSNKQKRELGDKELMSYFSLDMTKTDLIAFITAAGAANATM